MHFPPVMQGGLTFQEISVSPVKFLFLPFRQWDTGIASGDGIPVVINWKDILRNGVLDYLFSWLGLVHGWRAGLLSDFDLMPLP